MQVPWKYLASGVAVALVLGAAIVIAGAGSEQNGNRATEGTQPASSGQPESPPSFLPAQNTNIFVIDLATRSAEQVTKNRNAEIASDPSWSPRGKIFFSEAQNEGSRPRLFAIEPDGSAERTLPTRLRHLLEPAPSPDGRRLAAVELGLGVRVVDLRTGAVRRLTSLAHATAGPAWSPDGKAVVFQATGAGTSKLELYRVEAGGGTPTRLTRDQLQQSDPAWSPDGSRLVFSEQQPSGNWVLASMKLDGSDRRRLTDSRVSSQEPAWSPDGKKIAFVLQERSRGSIAVIDADGGSPARVAPSYLVAVSHPSWSPDGKRIAVVGRLGRRPPPAPAPAPGRPSE